MILLVVLFGLTALVGVLGYRKHKQYRRRRQIILGLLFEYGPLTTSEMADWPDGPPGHQSLPILYRLGREGLVRHSKRKDGRWAWRLTNQGVLMMVRRQLDEAES